MKQIEMAMVFPSDDVSYDGILLKIFGKSINNFMCCCAILGGRAAAQARSNITSTCFLSTPNSLD